MPVHRSGVTRFAAPSDTPGLSRARRGMLLATLFAAQVCGSTGFSLSFAVSSIMAAAITGTNTWAGIPSAVGALGTALASWPLSRLMNRHGRRAGLALGYSLGAVGAALAIVGMTNRSFSTFLSGMALFGIANTSNMLARYAAADVTPAAHRGRAMGLIVWGSTLGAIVGPNLMAPADRVGALVGLTPLASTFLISIATYTLAGVLIGALLHPDPLAVARAPAALEPPSVLRSGPRRARTSREVVREPRVLLAFGALMTSQLVMIGTTSTVAVYLHDHGYHASGIGLALSIHIGGMYVGSPLSGWLSDRFGRLPMIATGGAILIAGLAMAGVAPAGATTLIMAALFLNGIGWNLAFVSASALLTDALAPDERGSMQGLADLATGLMGALGSVMGGMVLGTWGFAALNALGAVMLVAAIAASWLQRAAVETESPADSPWTS